MNDIITLFARLPLSCEGCVTPTPDGDYIILLNDAYSREKQRQIYNHEMTHILENHFGQAARSVADMEAEAHSKKILAQRIRRASEQGLPLMGAVLRPTGTEQPPSAGRIPLADAPPEPLDELDAILALLTRIEGELELCAEERAEWSERLRSSHHLEDFSTLA